MVPSAHRLAPTGKQDLTAVNEFPCLYSRVIVCELLSFLNRNSSSTMLNASLTSKSVTLLLVKVADSIFHNDSAPPVISVISASIN